MFVIIRATHFWSRSLKDKATEKLLSTPPPATKTTTTTTTTPTLMPMLGQINFDPVNLVTLLPGRKVTKLTKGYR